MIALEARRVIEERRAVAAKAIVQVSMLPAVPHEDVVILASVKVDLGLRQEIASRLRQGGRHLDADVQGREEIELLNDLLRPGPLDVLTAEFCRAEEPGVTQHERSAARST